MLLRTLRAPVLCSSDLQQNCVGYQKGQNGSEATDNLERHHRGGGGVWGRGSKGWGWWSVRARCIWRRVGGVGRHRRVIVDREAVEESESDAHAKYTCSRTSTGA